jgi:hypothetical protein
MTDESLLEQNIPALRRVDASPFASLSFVLLAVGVKVLDKANRCYH